ncbi:MAG: amidohydrolase family protein [Burkholderiales bacterium]
MKRRTLLLGVAMGAGGLAGIRYWPDQGFVNPCLDPSLPDRLADHELVKAAWSGIDALRVWDCHVHLAGTGDGDSGLWVNPAMKRLSSPSMNLRYRFYMNAACVTQRVDESYIERLLLLQSGLKPGNRLMLLAFDYFHDAAGKPVTEASAFYVPNAYAARLADRHRDRCEWIASIHPWRSDAIDALERAAGMGARAVKWLPPAMGIDPASPRCDRYYAALIRLGLPLLTHGGDEHAVLAGPDAQRLGNPLLLRRPLEAGVKVIVAHCASLGHGVDLDRGRNAQPLPNFALFARLMDEVRFEKHLFADISALFQINRQRRVWDTVLARKDWHHRLINGSDYPLPAVMPLFSMDMLVEAGYLNRRDAEVLSSIRRHNPLLFDFVLKRTVAYRGQRFPPTVFESARLFASATKSSRIPADELTS